MLTLVDIIYICMKKKGIKTKQELLDKMNELDTYKFYFQHLNSIFTGYEINMNYLEAMEQVLDLNPMYLRNMIEQSNCRHKYIGKEVGVYKKEK